MKGKLNWVFLDFVPGWIYLSRPLSSGILPCILWQSATVVGLRIDWMKDDTVLNHKKSLSHQYSQDPNDGTDQWLIKLIFFSKWQPLAKLSLLFHAFLHDSSHYKSQPSFSPGHLYSGTLKGPGKWHHSFWVPSPVIVPPAIATCFTHICSYLLIWECLVSFFLLM